MAYRVQRREYVRYQPKWLFHFLLSLPPQIYEVKETLEEARANIRQVKDAIEENDLQAAVPRLRISYDDSHVVFTSRTGRPYLKFHIQDQYKRI